MKWALSYQPSAERHCGSEGYAQRLKASVGKERKMDVRDKERFWR